MTYTEEEINYIKTNYSKMTYSEIGKVLNRSKHSIRVKAAKLNLSKYKLQDDPIGDIVRLFLKYYCTTERQESIGETYKLIAKELGTSDKTIRVTISQNFPLAVSPLPKDK